MSFPLLSVLHLLILQLSCQNRNSFILSGIFFQIFHKAHSDQHDDHTYRECRYNADRLQIVHGAVRKDQRDRQQDQQDAPHQLYQFMRLLTLSKLMIAVTGTYQGNGIKGCGIKRYHGNQHQYQYEGCAGQCTDHLYNHIIEISVQSISCKKIRASQYLFPKRVIPQHNKADDCGTCPKQITAKNNLTNSSSL